MIPNTNIREMVEQRASAIMFNSRRSNGLDISQDCQYTAQLNLHTTQDSVTAKQEDTPGRPGLAELKRHYLCTTSLPSRHSGVQQTTVFFFP